MFTDKTGTLTENNMEFKECCVEGHVCVPHAVCNGQVLPDASAIDDYLCMPVLIKRSLEVESFLLLITEENLESQSIRKDSVFCFCL